MGVSACVLGEAVRYDGRHKYDPAVAPLADVFTLVPVCPEVEIGLGVPRETLRLTRRGGELRLIAESGSDHTETMREYARRRVRELERAGLCGYVFKRSSPSCGVAGVPVEGGEPAGRGVFAAELMRELSLLPVEEESALGDSATRDSFIERVFAYHRSRKAQPA